LDGRIAGGFRLTLLCYSIVGGVFGLIYLLVPDVWGRFIGWPSSEPIDRLLGATVLSFAASAWWAFRVGEWQEIRIAVRTNLLWTSLVTLILLWGIAFAGMPPAAWLNVALLGSFALAFNVFYWWAWRAGRARNSGRTGSEQGS
jgi:hypothetical protein